MIVEKLPDGHGLIDKVIIPFADFGKIINTNRQSLHDRSLLSKNPIYPVYSIRERADKGKSPFPLPSSAVGKQPEDDMSAAHAVYDGQYDDSHGPAHRIGQHEGNEITVAV